MQYLLLCCWRVIVLEEDEDEGEDTVGRMDGGLFIKTFYDRNLQMIAIS